MATLVAFDTNVLLALSYTRHPQWQAASDLMIHFGRVGTIGCFTAQTIREFWSVATKPEANNGFGLSTDDAASLVFRIERSLTLLADNEAAYALWLRLVSQHHVRGSQLHDTFLAATVAVHSVKTIATWNPTDFKRFDIVEALTPEQILGK